MKMKLAGHTTAMLPFTPTGAGDFMTVRHLTIGGTNREIGQALAETVMRRHGTSPADVRGDPPMVRA